MKNTRYINEYLKFITLLDKHKVDYLLIGAYATMIHTRTPRATKDIDTWVRQTEKNSIKLSKAIKELTGREISPKALLKKDQRIEIKSETFKIEIWTSQEIITFDQAWERRKIESVEGTPLNVISKEDLIKLKKHFNRPQDKIDLYLLEHENGK